MDEQIPTLPDDWGSTGSPAIDRALRIESLECAVLAAAEEWRKADAAVMECLKVPREERAGRWDEAHTDAVNQRIDGVTTLRSAVDELRRARGEKEGEG